MFRDLYGQHRRSPTCILSEPRADDGGSQMELDLSAVGYLPVRNRQGFRGYPHTSLHVTQHGLAQSLALFHHRDYLHHQLSRMHFHFCPMRSAARSLESDHQGQLLGSFGPAEL